MASIGIDFGTSTTEVAVHEGGRARLRPVEGGEEILPSVVAYPPSGPPVVGRRARARRLLDPTNTLESVKRIVGLSFYAKEVAEYRRDHRVPLEEGADGLPRFQTRAGALTPVEVASEILRVALGAARAGPLDRVVVAVPSTFAGAQRRGIADAAERAGMRQVVLIEEAHAAALPYLTGGARRRVLVYDLGGGTFDAAVLETTGRQARVVASGGDAHLGGDDVDRILAEKVVREVLERFQWDLSTSPQSLQDLRLECERAKIRLSLLETARVDLSLVDPVLQGRDLTLDRADLARAIHPLVQRTFAVVDDLLARAGLRPTDLDEVVLSGGSTALPSVREAVRQYFGREPETRLPPDQLVALGAAEWAEAPERLAVA